MSALGNLTDHALATIASILDHSDARREPEKPESLVPTMADGYTKIGPGPLAAMRLKWTVRRNVNNEYFVDEHHPSGDILTKAERLREVLYGRRDIAVAGQHNGMAVRKDRRHPLRQTLTKRVESPERPGAVGNPSGPATTLLEENRRYGSARRGR